MSLSYSCHLGSKSHSIHNLNVLMNRLKHNLRSYKSNEYNKNINEVLIGANNAPEAYQDFIETVNNEFKESLEIYNSKQKRKDRIINNYLEHINNSRNEIAAEMIIQVGDKDFWGDKNIEERTKMSPLFKNQLDRLQKEVPNFKIVSAVIHYDENSPHLQIIGIPIKENCKNGLSHQISKTAVFTKESLEKLQDNMRVGVEESMKILYGNDINLKAKEKGRNLDLFKNEYIRLKNEQKQKIDIELASYQKNAIQGITEQISELKYEIQEKEEEISKRKDFKDLSKVKEIEGRAIKKNKGLFDKTQVVQLEEKDYIDLNAHAISNQKILEEHLKLQNLYKLEKKKNKDLEKSKELLEKENNKYKEDSKILSSLKKAIEEIPVLKQISKVLNSVENHYTASSDYWFLKFVKRDLGLEDKNIQKENEKEK